MWGFLGKSLTFFVLLGTAASLHAQSGTAGSLSIEKTWPVAERPKRMHVYVSVHGPDGKAVGNLAEKDFSVQIDGAPAQILHFKPGIARGRKFGMALVMDGGRAPAPVRAAANEFARDLAGGLTDREPVRAVAIQGSASKDLGRSQSGQSLGVKALLGFAGGGAEPSDLLEGALSAINEGVGAQGDPDDSDFKRAKPAVFVVAVSPERSNQVETSVRKTAIERGVPVFVADFGGHNPDLKALVEGTGGAYRADLAGMDAQRLALVASDWVAQAHRKVEDQYVLDVEAAKEIGPLYTVELARLQDGTPVAKAKFATFSPLVWILPVGAIVVALFSMVVMVLSYRRVMSKIDDERYDPTTGRLSGELDPTKPKTPRQKIESTADRVTAKLLRNRAEAPTRPKAKPEGASPRGGTAPREDRDSGMRIRIGVGGAPGPLALQFEGANGPGRVVPIEGRMVLGREDGGLKIDDPGASRRHAEIVASGGGATIRDLDSSNGTYVNGRAIQSEVRLSPGDRLEIGDTLLVVRLATDGGEADPTERRPTEPRKGRSGR